MSKTIRKRNLFAKELERDLYRQRVIGGGKVRSPPEIDEWDDEAYELDKDLGLTSKE